MPGHPRPVCRGAVPAQRGARPVRRGVLPGVALALAVVTAGCGSTHQAARHSTKASSPASTPAVRWWSNSAVTLGATIDPAHPEAAAAKLHTSKADYCGMLKQTVDAGKSILPNTSAADPALVTSTRAFIAEIEKVVPPDIAGQWQVIGPAILVLVQSGGDTGALPSVDLGALTKAATAISDDSLKNCGVDLSSVTGLLPSGR